LLIEVSVICNSVQDIMLQDYAAKKKMILSVFFCLDRRIFINRPLHYKWVRWGWNYDVMGTKDAHLWQVRSKD
jgi:hypothetical protein